MNKKLWVGISNTVATKNNKSDIDAALLFESGEYILLEDDEFYLSLETE